MIAARRLYDLFQIVAGGCQRIGIEEFGDADVGVLHFGAFDGVKGHGLLKKLLESGLQEQRKSRVLRYPIPPPPALYKSKTTLETFSKPHAPFFVWGYYKNAAYVIPGALYSFLPLFLKV